MHEKLWNLFNLWAFHNFKDICTVREHEQVLVWWIFCSTNIWACLLFFIPSNTCGSVCNIFHLFQISSLFVMLKFPLKMQTAICHTSIFNRRKLQKGFGRYTRPPAILPDTNSLPTHWNKTPASVFLILAVFCLRWLSLDALMVFSVFVLSNVPARICQRKLDPQEQHWRTGRPGCGTNKTRIMTFWKWCSSQGIKTNSHYQPYHTFIML